MKNGAPNITVIGEGRTGSGFVPSAFADAAHGLYDAERAGHEQLRLRNGHGAHDVSPTPAQVVGGSTGKDPRAAHQQVVHDLFVRAQSGIVRSHAHDGITIVAHEDADLVAAPLLHLAHQLPQQRLVSLCAFPEAGRDGTHATNGCTIAAIASATLTAVGHYGPRSPFAATNSPTRQEAFVVATHNAIANAPRSHPGNPTAGDLYERLGSLGPCFQFGFASLPLALIRPRRFWGAMRRVGRGPFTPAYGSLDNALKVAAAAALRAHAAESLTTNEAFDATTPHFVVVIVPFSPRGAVFREFVERQSVWLAAHYPAATGVFVSGNGTPPLDGEGERFLQVSILAPLESPRSGRA
jgi:hypothetical protein